MHAKRPPNPVSKVNKLILFLKFGSISMKRYGMVIKVKPEKFEEYKKLHAAVWPEVLDMQLFRIWWDRFRGGHGKNGR
jgi:hypothetical protein